MRTILIPIAALTLGACQAAEDTADNVIDPASNVSNYTAEVIALPEGQRNAVFFRAIRDARLSCQGVTGSEQIAAIGGKPTWRARCDDGVAHLIQVMPDGTVNVMSRHDS